MGFYIITDTYVDYLGDSAIMEYGDERFRATLPENFSDKGKALVLTYFAFTSLSTVGFGDYHPMNSIERILCIFILVFGVMIFSYMMGSFLEIMSKYKALNETLDNGDELTRFFVLLKKWNYDKPIPMYLIKDIEMYFDYKWNFDRN